MKNIKNVIRTLLLLFIAIISFFGQNVLAATAPNTFQTASSFTKLDGYVNGAWFYIQKTTSGNIVYCTDRSKSVPRGMTFTKVGEQNAGITYIMVNGYPNKSITGNSNYDYYITQSALWWYLDSTTGSKNLENSFKTNGSDPHGLRPHIKKLVDGALNAKNSGYAKPSLSFSSAAASFSLSSDGKYYVSSNITVSASSIKDNVKLSLTGAPTGSVIIDSNGKTITTASNGAKVRVKVPVSAMSKLQYSITLKATATGSVKKSYLYKPSNTSYQSVTMSVLYAQETALSATKALTVKGTEVKITKVDSETGKAVAGAKLQLTNSSGKVVASWTSTTSAYVIKNLAAGKYTLSETAAPSGYKLSNVKQDVTITAGASVSVKFNNTKNEPTELSIIKRDKDTNATLAGAKFVLKNASGETVSSWTSTEKAHYLKGLPEGTYTLEEVEAPTGYVKQTETKTVKLEAGKETVVTFYNTKKEETKLSIIKRDTETNATLAGAKFVLKNASGDVVASWTSTDKAYDVNGLPEGKYTVEEVEAPLGYVKSDDIKTVTLVSGKEVVVTFYNTKTKNKPTIVKILKVNGETGKAVAGADLVLKDKDGNIIDAWTSTTKAKVFDNLENGTYYLSETKAPKGFTLSGDIITIEVTNDGNTHEVVFRNVPKYRVPDTGSEKSIITAIAGTIFIVLGGTVLYKNRKKEA